MGMGYSGASAIVIDTEKVEGMNLATYQNLVNKLDEFDSSIGALAQAIDREYYIEDLEDEENDELFTLYEAFKEEFKSVTGVGVELAYHDRQDDGSRYDQVDGAFFALDYRDVYELTPAAKKLKETAGFEEKYFVVFG